MAKNGVMAGPYSVLRLVPWFLPWPIVSGRVLRYWITRGDGQRFHHPVVQFEIDGGATVVAISNHGTWNRPWEPGEQILLRYCPENPRHVEIDSFHDNWGLLLTVLGLIAMGIGVAAVRFNWGIW